MHSGFRRRIQQYIASWERKGYADGIPDEAPETLERNGRVPSYRLICIAIMKNDYTLELLGSSRPKCALYSQLKRIEIQARESSGQGRVSRGIYTAYSGASRVVAEELAVALKAAGAVSAFSCRANERYETRVNRAHVDIAKRVASARKEPRTQLARVSAIQQRFEWDGIPL